MEQTLNLRTMTFVAPSGHSYTIREQNGADDDILSNPYDAATLMNLSKFIAALVQETTATTSGKLTAQQAHSLPTLDRYCILIKSRIFSMGETLEFSHDWGANGGEIEYEQNLNEFLFDYTALPTQEVLEAKPDAIPYYPDRDKLRDVVVELSTGKKIKFDLSTGESESYLISLPVDQRTRNKELMARNLCLEVDGKWEKVQSFHLFTLRDMAEIRQTINSYDPSWAGLITISNGAGETTQIPLMGITNFFYPEEI
jgi:hypothetical protein